MNNKYRLPYSPIKREAGVKLLSHPSKGAYTERLIYTSIIKSFDTSSEDFDFIWLPYYEGHAALATLLESFEHEEHGYSNPPHFNPKDLRVSIRITYEDGGVPVIKYFSFEGSSLRYIEDGGDWSIPLPKGALDSSVEGGRVELLYPIDDGIRFVGEVSSVVNSMVTCKAGSSVDGIPLIPLDSSFDAYVIYKGVLEGLYKVSGVNFTDQDSPVILSLDGKSSEIKVGSVLFVKSGFWSGFCNPLKDVESSLPVEYFNTLEEGFVQSPMFDYELDYTSGSIKWFGNWLYGTTKKSSLSIGPAFGITSSSFSLGVSIVNPTKTSYYNPYFLNLEVQVKNISESSLGSLKVIPKNVSGDFKFTLGNTILEVDKDGVAEFLDLEVGIYPLRVESISLGEVFYAYIELSSDLGGSTVTFLDQEYTPSSQSFENYSSTLTLEKAGFYSSDLSDDASISILPEGSGSYVFTKGEEVYTVLSGQGVTFSGLVEKSFHYISFRESLTGVSGYIEIYFDVAGNSYITVNPSLDLEKGFTFSKSLTSVDLQFTGSLLPTDEGSIDKGFFSTSSPVIPYNTTLSSDVTLLGTSGLIGESEAYFLTSGGLDASHLHTHNYPTQEEIQNKVLEASVSLNHDALNGVSSFYSYQNENYLHLSQQDYLEFGEAFSNSESIIRILQERGEAEVVEEEPLPEPPQEDTELLDVDNIAIDIPSLDLSAFNLSNEDFIKDPIMRVFPLEQEQNFLIFTTSLVFTLDLTSFFNPQVLSCIELPEDFNRTASLRSVYIESLSNALKKGDYVYFYETKSLVCFTDDSKVSILNLENINDIFFEIVGISLPDEVSSQIIDYPYIHDFFPFSDSHHYYYYGEVLDGCYKFLSAKYERILEFSIDVETFAVNILELPSLSLDHPWELSDTHRISPHAQFLPQGLYSYPVIISYYHAYDVNVGTYVQEKGLFLFKQQNIGEGFFKVSEEHFGDIELSTPEDFPTVTHESLYDTRNSTIITGDNYCFDVVDPLDLSTWVLRGEVPYIMYQFLDYYIFSDLTFFTAGSVYTVRNLDFEILSEFKPSTSLSYYGPSAQHGIYGFKGSLDSMQIIDLTRFI